MNSIGINDENIIEIALDEVMNARYRNPFELDQYIREQVVDKSQKYYVFIDEIQKVSQIQNPYVDDADAKVGFVDVLLGLMKIKNVDLYVTGSNSRMLSSDILTEFKDRGDEIRINPLTYSEFYAAFEGEKQYAWREYYTYGGMPLVLSKKTHEEKSKYLKDLFAKTYISDVLEHNKILNEQVVLEDLLNIVSSSVGSLTNPTRLANTFRSVKQMAVGVVEYHHMSEDGKKVRTQLEIDFVANKGSKRYYIQSALTVADEAQREQETNSLNRVSDSFRKIIVVKDDIIPWHDEQGILYVGIEQFLLDEGAVDI